jgi:hypothetical protein
LGTGLRHYLVLHPECYRHTVRVGGRALSNNGTEVKWRGEASVDWTGTNSDPLVLGRTWAYSYCKTRHLGLRSGQLGDNSCIVFASGDFASRRSQVVVDTVFWIAKIHKWRGPRTVPLVFANRSKRGRLWREHLAAGGRVHPGRFTIEGKRWSRSSTRFSYLPLDARGLRPAIPFGSLPVSVRRKILRSIDPALPSRQRKRPVPLTDLELRKVLLTLRRRVRTRVVGPLSAPRLKNLPARARGWSGRLRVE